MYRKLLINMLLLACIFSLTACMPTPATSTVETNLPNPASVYCEANGGKLELRTDATGAVTGYCLFQNGGECEEWAYYRGECQPANAIGTPESTFVPVILPTATTAEEFAGDGCRIYRNADLGYSFHYPADAHI